jgi:hypothetical protein
MHIVLDGMCTHLLFSPIVHQVPTSESDHKNLMLSQNGVAIIIIMIEHRVVLCLLNCLPFSMLNS